MQVPGGRARGAARPRVRRRRHGPAPHRPVPRHRGGARGQAVVRHAAPVPRPPGGGGARVGGLRVAVLPPAVGDGGHRCRRQPCGGGRPQVGRLGGRCGLHRGEPVADLRPALGGHGPAAVFQGVRPHGVPVPPRHAHGAGDLLPHGRRAEGGKVQPGRGGPLPQDEAGVGLGAPRGR